MSAITTGLPSPGAVTSDPALDPERVESAVLLARRFYAFWDTGNAARLDTVVAPSFIDHTLPPGRPPGPTGPAVASRELRTAIPDLRCQVLELVVAGDRLTARLRFHGTFTGSFGERTGSGQPLDFTAIDVLGIRNGRVTDNWHLEDNLTLMRQLGVVAPADGHRRRDPLVAAYIGMKR
jgi:predicted ester cyclase